MKSRKTKLTVRQVNLLSSLYKQEYRFQFVKHRGKTFTFYNLEDQKLFMVMCVPDRDTEIYNTMTFDELVLVSRVISVYRNSDKIIEDYDGRKLFILLEEISEKVKKYVFDGIRYVEWIDDRLYSEKKMRQKKNW